MPKHLTQNELLLLAESVDHQIKCTQCQSLDCASWESIPGGFDASTLVCIGTLRVEGAQECWEENHPHGTNMWSREAPISLNYHPYNKSDLYQCKQCGTRYLRYTEYGGYYIDERIRELNVKLIL